MKRVLEALRHNPDAAALAVLCLVLGIGRQNMSAHSMTAFSETTLGIHWGCPKPAADVLDTLGARLRALIDSATEALPAPPALPPLSPRETAGRYFRPRTFAATTPPSSGNNVSSRNSIASSVTTCVAIPAGVCTREII